MAARRQKQQDARLASILARAFEARAFFVAVLLFAMLYSAAAAQDAKLAGGETRRQQEIVAEFAALKADELERAGELAFDYRLGTTALAAGQPLDAMFALERVLDAAPGHLPARFALAHAFAALGELAAARREFAIVAAQESVPEDVRNTINRNIAALDTGIERQAALLRAQRIGQAYRQGTAALDAGGTEDAIAILQQVLTVDPDHLPARAELGRAYAAAGDYDAARQELSTVAEADSAPPEVRDAIGRHIAALDTRLAAPQRTRVSGHLRVRSGFDSNVNNATDEERILIPAFAALGLATLDPNAREQSDGFVDNAARLSVTHGLSAKGRLLADVSGNFRKNFDEGRFDQVVLGGNLGYARATAERGTFTIAAQGQTFLVDEDVFRNAFGALAGWSKRTEGGTDVAANLQYSYLDFPDEPVRNAHRVSLGGTLGRTLGTATYAFGGAYGGREDTSKGFDNLNQWFFGARAGVETRAGERLRLSLTALGERQIFDDPEPLFMTERRTWRLDLRGSARYRLSDALSLLLTLGYTRGDSNIVLFDYSRVTAAFGVEYGF